MLAILVVPSVSLGEIVYTGSAPVTKIWTWANTGTSVDGDAIVHINTNVASCPSGVFVQDSEGSEKAYSSALTAYTVGKNVRVQVYDDQLWAGSSTPYCKVRAIFLE